MIEDDFERGYHKGYVDRTKNVLVIIHKLKREYNLIHRLEKTVMLRAFIRRLKKRVIDTGIVILPKIYER